MSNVVWIAAGVAAAIGGVAIVMPPNPEP